MKVLVLGGTRFIGRAIVDALLPSHEVSVLNRGTQPLWDSRITQLTADRTEAGQVAAVLGGRYDAVVDVSGTEPAHIGNVLKAMPQLDGTAYVFISSAAVYNRVEATPPFREGDRADGDDIWGGYGEAKAACEDLLREAVPEGQLTILRPPYVYGPRNTEPREQFLWARILGGQPVFLPGEGSTRIQFLHAEVLAGIVASACEGHLAPGTYNVGERRDYSFREYLSVLAEVAGTEARLVDAPDTSVRARDYFPFRDAELVLDVDRLTAADVVLDLDLGRGLAGTLRWFREHDGIHDEPTPVEQAWRATTHP
jgi:2'-hydroxyisoflavone reductase